MHSQRTTLATALLALLIATATTWASLTITITPYGYKPYSPHVPGTIFNLYEWVVINGTVVSALDHTISATVYVTIKDLATGNNVAGCTASDVPVNPGSNKIYQLLTDRCTLSITPSYSGRVSAGALMLNFTDLTLVGVNRYEINITIVSGTQRWSSTTKFSISKEISLTVRPFNQTAVTDGGSYKHNLGYHFRLAVEIRHPDGRPYYNTSLTVFVNNAKKLWKIWGTDNKTDFRFVDLIIPDSEFSSTGNYRFMVNVSTVRYNAAGAKVVGASVNSTGRLNFTLVVSNQLVMEFINVTAVWSNYTSTPPALRNKPTGVNYMTHAGFNSSQWTVGDAFLMYVRVRFQNGTQIAPSTLEFRDYAGLLTTGVMNVTRVRGQVVVVAVNASLPRSEWNSYYRRAVSGVRINATLTVSVDSNTGRLAVRFIVRNDTQTFAPALYYNVSKSAVGNGSRINLWDVLTLRLTVKTWGGRQLNFSMFSGGGFDVRVYNRTATSALNNYTDLFIISGKNDEIYLRVKAGRDTWKLRDWRRDMNRTRLVFNVTERGASGRVNLTLLWPRRFVEINVTARLPSVSVVTNVTEVDYGKGVKLAVIFQTYGGARFMANNLSLYVYKIDAAVRPFGFQNASKPFIKGDVFTGSGNYTFVFNVNGSKIWIPGRWFINATVGDIRGNAGDVNNTEVFTIRPRIYHTLPASLRSLVSKPVTISGNVKWGNGTDAKVFVTIKYPAPDGRSNLTATIGTISGSFSFTFQAPEVVGEYKVVVELTYTPFGKSFTDVHVVSLTVYVAVNDTIKEMRNNPGSVAVAVGRSTPRGPVRGALVEDNLAAAALAAVIGTTNVFLDDELIDPATLGYRPAATGYRYIVAVGGPLVNLASYKYNGTLSSLVRTYKVTVGEDVVEVGFEILVPADIRRAYLNLTDNSYYILYANGTRKRVGVYERFDFAVVATVYDSAADKYVFISFGLDWRGTLAAGRWIAHIVQTGQLDALAGGQLVLLGWSDDDNDGSVEAGEVRRILAS